MRILLYGDLQTNHRRPDYMQFLTKTLEYLVSVIEDRQPDLVVNLGDTFDTKNLVSVDDLVYGWQWSRRIGSARPPVSASGTTTKRHWVLKGNHDISDKHGDRASIQVLEEPNTLVCMGMGMHVVNGLRVLVIPYDEDVNSIYQSLHDCTDRPDLILGHCDWLGCRLTPHYVSKAGLDPAWFAKNYPGVPVFNGHYHHPMDVGDLHFVGSPVHKDFNDIAGEIPRGFSLWDSETGDVERIVNPHTYYCLQLSFTEEEEMRAWADKLRPDAERLRIKVAVPQRLLDEAKESFEDYLWHTIQPIDTEAIRAIHTSGITAQSTPSEVVTTGVGRADPEVYDCEMLATFGRKAFGA